MQDSELQQLAITDRNPVQETRYQQLLRDANVPHTVENGKANVQGFGTGGNTATVDQFNQVLQPGGTTATSAFNQPTINLPQLYDTLYNSSGIKATEDQLTQKTNDYNGAVSTIKDNPYLSEGTMTGRIDKIDKKFNADAQNIKNDIAMRKADIETKLNLQTKQFDINSQQARQAFDQFQSLLSSGALDNASGESIAQITRATGLSSSMIQSAIGTSKAKNAPKVNTSIIQFDDGDNTGYAVVNSDTGAIINRQVVAASKPSAIEQKAITGGGATAKPLTAAQTKSKALLTAKEGANKGVTLGTMMNDLQQFGLTKQQIYDAYRAANYYKPTKTQIAADKKKYNVK